MWPSRSTSEPNQALVASLHQKSSALNAALEGQKAMRHRLASVFLSASIRARQHARLARALGRWAHAATAMAAVAAAAPTVRKLRATQAMAEQLSTKVLAAEARQKQGQQAVDDAEEEARRLQRLVNAAEKREAAERSRRGAGEAAEKRQRRERGEVKAAAVRRLLRGANAGRVGDAFVQWRLVCKTMAAIGDAAANPRPFVAWKEPAPFDDDDEAAADGGEEEAEADSFAMARLTAAAERRLSRVVRGLWRETKRRCFGRWQRAAAAKQIAQLNTHAHATHARVASATKAERRRLLGEEQRLQSEAAALGARAAEQAKWHETYRTQVMRMAGRAMTAAATSMLTTRLMAAVARWRHAASALGLETALGAATDEATRTAKRLGALEARPVAREAELQRERRAKDKAEERASAAEARIKAAERGLAAERSRAQQQQQRAAQLDKELHAATTSQQSARVAAQQAGAAVQRQRHARMAALGTRHAHWRCAAALGTWRRAAAVAETADAATAALRAEAASAADERADVEAALRREAEALRAQLREAKHAGGTPQPQPQPQPAQHPPPAGAVSEEAVAEAERRGYSRALLALEGMPGASSLPSSLPPSTAATATAATAATAAPQHAAGATERPLPPPPPAVPPERLNRLLRVMVGAAWLRGVGSALYAFSRWQIVAATAEAEAEADAAIEARAEAEASAEAAYLQLRMQRGAGGEATLTSQLRQQEEALASSTALSRRLAVSRAFAPARARQNLRLARALGQWTFAAAALALAAAAAPTAKKLRASQAMVEQLSAKALAAEARQKQGKRAAEEAEEEVRRLKGLVSAAERREAGERSRREAQEAVARQRREKRPPSPAPAIASAPTPAAAMPGSLRRAASPLTSRGSVQQPTVRPAAGARTPAAAVTFAEGPPSARMQRGAGADAGAGAAEGPQVRAMAVLCALGRSAVMARQQRAWGRWVAAVVAEGAVLAAAEWNEEVHRRMTTIAEQAQQTQRYERHAAREDRRAMWIRLAASRVVAALDGRERATMLRALGAWARAAELLAAHEATAERLDAAEGALEAERRLWGTAAALMGALALGSGARGAWHADRVALRGALQSWRAVVVSVGAMARSAAARRAVRAAEEHAAAAEAAVGDGVAAGQVRVQQKEKQASANKHALGQARLAAETGRREAAEATAAAATAEAALAAQAKAVASLKAELQQAQQRARANEAAARGRREAGEAAARRRLEARVAAVRSVVRGAKATRLSRALVAWRAMSRAAPAPPRAARGGLAGLAGLQRLVTWREQPAAAEAPPSPSPAAPAAVELRGGGGGGGGGDGENIAPNSPRHRSPKRGAGGGGAATPEARRRVAAGVAHLAVGVLRAREAAALCSALHRWHTALVAGTARAALSAALGSAAQTVESARAAAASDRVAARGAAAQQQHAALEAATFAAEEEKVEALAAAAAQQQQALEAAVEAARREAAEEQATASKAAAQREAAAKRQVPARLEVRVRQAQEAEGAAKEEAADAQRQLAAQGKQQAATAAQLQQALEREAKASREARSALRKRTVATRAGAVGRCLGHALARRLSSGVHRWRLAVVAMGATKRAPPPPPPPHSSSSMQALAAAAPAPAVATPSTTGWSLWKARPSVTPSASRPLPADASRRLERLLSLDAAAASAAALHTWRAVVGARSAGLAAADEQARRRRGWHELSAQRKAVAAERHEVASEVGAAQARLATATDRLGRARALAHRVAAALLSRGHGVRAATARALGKWRRSARHLAEGARAEAWRGAAARAVGLSWCAGWHGWLREWPLAEALRAWVAYAAEAALDDAREEGRGARQRHAWLHAELHEAQKQLSVRQRLPHSLNLEVTQLRQSVQTAQDEAHKAQQQLRAIRQQRDRSDERLRAVQAQLRNRDILHNRERLAAAGGGGGGAPPSSSQPPRLEDSSGGGGGGTPAAPTPTLAGMAPDEAAELRMQVQEWARARAGLPAERGGAPTPAATTEAAAAATPAPVAPPPATPATAWSGGGGGDGGGRAGEAVRRGVQRAVWAVMRHRTARTLLLASAVGRWRAACGWLTLRHGAGALRAEATGARRGGRVATAALGVEVRDLEHALFTAREAAWREARDAARQLEHESRARVRAETTLRRTTQPLALQQDSSRMREELQREAAAGEQARKQLVTVERHGAATAAQLRLSREREAQALKEVRAAKREAIVARRSVALARCLRRASDAQLAWAIARWAGQAEHVVVREPRAFSFSPPRPRVQTTDEERETEQPAPTPPRGGGGDDSPLQALLGFFKR